MTIYVFILCFFVYSFIGWLYESTICSYSKYKRFINRGYLKGPYCPIYGVGALINCFFLGSINNPLIIFFLAMILCGAVEYITSYAMEKLFKARWWDYSDMAFNINGRVCLFGCLVFGVAFTVVIFFVHPMIVNVIKLLSPIFVYISSILLLLLFIYDNIFTILHYKDLAAKLKRYQAKISAQLRIKEKLAKTKLKYSCRKFKQIRRERPNFRFRNLRINFKKSELRFFKAFPDFRSTKYYAFISKYINKNK